MIALLWKTARKYPAASLAVSAVSIAIAPTIFSAVVRYSVIVARQAGTYKRTPLGGWSARWEMLMEPSTFPMLRTPFVTIGCCLLVMAIAVRRKSRPDD